ncbi:HET-domain-containing protein [Nemania diffusa]|nr:HET-domain-containing protein [Nemania diffusa]
MEKLYNVKCHGFLSYVGEYAILSHTWDEDEVTFQDMKGTDEVLHRKGYAKVKHCCFVARTSGFDYVWIDTCCIDKTSTAELSEAINSMYSWYIQAEVCYAYLADMPSYRADHLADGHSRLKQSKWFTRGWTLQELIAPSKVVFLDYEWKEFGTKSSLQQSISHITGIPVRILSEDDDLETASIAQRMSWAANRKTSRPEDQAYCLMGLFGINMPLLYGEGKMAFVRLQEEIMKVSDDHSIFAWTSKDRCIRRIW